MMTLFTSIQFLAPEWFILMPVFIFLGWYWPELKLKKPLRITCLALLTLALAQPQWQMLQPGLDLWVLVDRSDSAEEQLTPKLAEWENLIRSKQGPDDRLHFIDFASDAYLRDNNENAIYSGNTNSTRIDLAAQLALLKKDDNRAHKLLVLSDSLNTAPLDTLQERLINEEVPLEYRLLSTLEYDDYEAKHLQMPNRVQVNEPFLIDLGFGGPQLEKTSYQLMRDGQVISKGELSAEAQLRLNDRISKPGSYAYTVQLIAPDDPRPGNNTITRWIEITAGPRILLITSIQNDPLQAVLEKQGFSVEVVTEYSKLHDGRLSGARLVILNDVPSHVLPNGVLDSLDFFVRGQGGGLVMIGGKHSFGSGGYFQSPIDELLPVSMELKEEHRKLAVAMAIVMDRSGSMAASVGNGMTKMDLANAGAASTANLLGPYDALTVFAVDSEAHTIVPLTALRENREGVMDFIRRIESRGGGIFVYTGLKAGWEELQKADVGQKHIILFSDAADSEEPGSYKKLLKEITEAGATVSVIGLGTENDPDAKFLQDIAKRGNGRIFFNQDPQELPRLFAQETVTVARSAYIDEITIAQATAGWLELSAQPLKWMDGVDGYNLSYLRPQATQALKSNDSYKAPLVAYWPRGAGRAAAITFPLSGPQANLILDWEQYGNFTQTLTRWLMGEKRPPGIGLKTKLEGSRLSIELLYDESWETKIAQDFPRAILTTDNFSSSKALTWERIKPGHFKTTQELEYEKPYKGAVQIGQHVLPFGPIAAGENIEWQNNAQSKQELATLALKTGGDERLNLANVWETTETLRYGDLTHWILTLLFGIALLDFFRTRWSS